MTLVECSEHILVTLLKTQRAYKKDYSFPSQKTIMSNMEKYRRVKKSKATLNRRLRRTEDERLVIRKRRIKRHPVQGLMFDSTMYFIQIRGYQMLARLGYNVAIEIKNLIAALRYKFPGFAARSTKKMLDDAKPNIKHGGNINKILNSLAENLSVPA